MGSGGVELGVARPHSAPEDEVGGGIGAFEIEIDQPSAIWHALKVKPYGHRVSADLLTSGTHVIVMRKEGLLAS